MTLADCGTADGGHPFTFPGWFMFHQLIAGLMVVEQGSELLKSAHSVSQMQKAGLTGLIEDE